MNGFTMLPSYYEALRPLPDDMRWQMYDAIFDYAFAGKEPEGLSPVLSGFFTLLRPNIDSSIRHYSTSVENGKKGGRPSKKPGENLTETRIKPGENREKEKEKEKEKECDKDREKDKEKCTADKPPHARFSPPSLEEVTAYCTERGNKVDPQRFIDYYTANGWKVGKNQMKDWRAAVRTWERNALDKPSKGKITERDYSAPPGFDFL